MLRKTTINLTCALLCTLLSQVAIAQIPNPAIPTKPIILTQTPKNPLVVNGKTYLLPDYLKIIKGADGKFKIDGSTDHRVGNGGDYLRTQFLTVGGQVMKYIEKSDVVRDDHLNNDDLRSTLDINRIAVVDELLIDNSGSVVDAIGIPGLILINADSWKEHFEKQRNIYYLVFHEMLRSAAVNDDNYVISKKITDFPAALQVNTRLVNQLPLLAEDSLAGIIERAKIVSGGNGCPNNSTRLFTDLNMSNNSYELSLYDYVSTVNVGKLFDRKACNLSIPVTLPKGKKLTITLIDMQGNVSGPNATSNTKGTINFEAFMAGASQKVQTKTVILNQGDRSFIMRKTNVLSSGCGGEAIVRLNTNTILTYGGPPAAMVKPQQTVGSTPPPVPSEMLQVKKLSIYMSLEDCQ